MTTRPQQHHADTVSNVAAVWFDGNDLHCHAGIIRTPHTAWHDSPTRPCIHVIGDQPHALLFRTSGILAVGFQPVVYTHNSWPSIVRRNGDIVTMTFDQLGDVAGCRRIPKGPLLKPAATYRYRLQQMRWQDEDEPEADTLLGVWPD